MCVCAVVHRFFLLCDVCVMTTKATPTTKIIELRRRRTTKEKGEFAKGLEI